MYLTNKIPIILIIFYIFKNIYVKGANVSSTAMADLSTEPSSVEMVTEVDMEALKRHLFDVLPIGQGLTCSYAFAEYLMKYPTLDYHLAQCYCFNMTEFCGFNIETEEIIVNWRTSRVFSLDNPTKRNIQIVMTTIAVLIGILGILGNLLVIITVLGWLPRDNVTYIFIANLSIADTLVIAGCLPLRTHEFLYVFWTLDIELCYFMTHLFYTSLALSVFTQTAMAMERYFVICFPMKAQIISTSSRARYICGIIWIISVSVAVLPTYLIAELASDRENIFLCYIPPKQEVNRSRIQMFYVDVVLFLIPTGLMGFAYTSVGRTLYRSIRESKQLTGSDSSGSDKRNAAKENLNMAKNRIKVVRLLVLVLVVFLVCWLPFVLYHTIEVISPYFYTNRLFVGTQEGGEYRDTLKFSFTLLTYFNSCLNPILYAFLSPQFRKGMMKALTCGRGTKGSRGSELTSKVTGVSTLSNSSYSVGESGLKSDGSAP